MTIRYAVRETCSDGFHQYWRLGRYTWRLGRYTGPEPCSKEEAYSIQGLVPSTQAPARRLLQTLSASFPTRTFKLVRLGPKTAPSTAQDRYDFRGQAIALRNIILEPICRTLGISISSLNIDDIERFLRQAYGAGRVQGVEDCAGVNESAVRRALNIDRKRTIDIVLDRIRLHGGSDELILLVQSALLARLDKPAGAP